MNTSKFRRATVLFLWLLLGMAACSDDNASASYMVTFDSQGATVAAVPATMTVTPPATTVGTLPAPPVRTGHDFAGWYTATNGGGMPFTASTPVTTNITVYACWNAHSYTVTYNSMGGMPVDPQQVIFPATNVGTLPAPPVRTGHDFAGWYTATNGGGTPFTANTPVTANITVYACWNAHYHTVTYNSTGGMPVDPQQVIFPATNVGTLPAPPVRTGYIFAGWYTAENGGGTEFLATTTVSSDLMVYANWLEAGASWTGHSLPASTAWAAVTYGNGVFVAIAAGGTTAATSPDGVTWTARTLPTGTSWQSVTWGNGLFVAVAWGSTAAATSPDGETWTARTLPSANHWYEVTYGNGRFVAVASGPSRISAVSTNGITWTTNNLPESKYWVTVTWGSTNFVAVAWSSSSAATSPDGITWTASVLPNDNWRSVTWGNGVFVAVAELGSHAATSPDGVTWTQRTLPAVATWRSVTYGNGVFVTVAENSTNAATSPDGVTWTKRTLPKNAAWRSVAYGDGVFVTVANNSTNAATSP